MMVMATAFSVHIEGSHFLSSFSPFSFSSSAIEGRWNHENLCFTSPRIDMNSNNDSLQQKLKEVGGKFFASNCSHLGLQSSDIKDFKINNCTYIKSIESLSSKNSNNFRFISKFAGQGNKILRASGRNGVSKRVNASNEENLSTSSSPSSQPNKSSKLNKSSKPSAESVFEALGASLIQSRSQSPQPPSSSPSSSHSEISIPSPSSSCPPSFNSETAIINASSLSSLSEEKGRQPRVVGEGQSNSGPNSEEISKISPNSGFVSKKEILPEKTIGTKGRESMNKINNVSKNVNDGGEPQWQNAFPAYMQSKEDKELAKSWKEELVNGVKMAKPGKAVNGVPTSGPCVSGGNRLGEEKAIGASKGASEATTKIGYEWKETGYGLKNSVNKEEKDGKHDKDVDVSMVTPAASAAQPPVTAGKKMPEILHKDPVWAAIRAEAKLEAEREPLLSSFLYASILAHSCFERSLGFVLANRLKNATLLATQLLDVFDDVIMQDSIRHAIRADVQAVKDRDPSCRSYSSALLYFKGYHAIQSYRIGHALWKRGQKVLALALQSRISEVFAVDIHPAAKIGCGILLDHGTGVVIGETAVIGDRVSMLQGVTLGGTGKEAGDRHPKIHEGVLIGAGATVLGNITVGKGAMVAAGSLVLKNVPPHSMVAGTPAKVVGMLEEKTPALSMKHDVARKFCLQWEDAVRLQGSDNLIGGAGI